MTPYWKARSLGICTYPSCTAAASGCHCDEHAKRSAARSIASYYERNMSKHPDPLSEQIRARREAAGLTQRSLAAASGLSSNFINLVECGHRVLSGKAAARVARALGCRIELVPLTKKERSRK